MPVLNQPITIERTATSFVEKQLLEPYYFVLVFDGTSSFSVDMTQYECEGKNLLFLSPYQLLQWHHSSANAVDMVRFHGDFYCIEYHKKEVSCNGVLFNAIYQQPFVTVSTPVYEEITGIMHKMQLVGNANSAYDVSVLKSYLQLILALSSKEKQLQILPVNQGDGLNNEILDFQLMLESHFNETKEVAFYAAKFGLSIDAFSKKVKKQFGKPPTKLIQERIVMEAKKQLHLTYKSIKEIAAVLHFEDEFYFSRYFKKEVGVSPKKFREEVGISIVAK